jgi:hypothetical protein
MFSLRSGGFQLTIRLRFLYGTPHQEKGDPGIFA